MNLMREFWFESEGTKLFTVEDGAGRPIVMLHGGLADHRAAWPLVAPLATRFRLILPDLRASGKSHDARSLTWDLLADDLAALLDTLTIEKAVVGGVSGGTGVALRFALRFPARVAGLVLALPVYGGAEMGLTPEQAATFAMMDNLGRRAPNEGVQVLRPLFTHLPAEVREGALAMLAEFDPASVASTTRFLAAGEQPFQTATELTALTVPTLLLPGNDALHPTAVSALYSSLIPHCQTSPREADGTGAIGVFCDRQANW